MNITEHTHYIRNNILAFVFGIIVPTILLLASPSTASAVYLISGLFALLPANIAYHKGRNFAKWFINGVLLWLIATIHSICIHDNDKAKLRKGHKKCPHCGEFSRPEATVCRCCGRDLA